MNRLQRLKHIPEPYLVLGIGFLALMIRISFSFLLYPHLEGPLSLGTDPDLFGQLAQNWADGKGYVFYEGDELTTYRGPGYPLLLAVVYLIFGNLFPAAVLTQCLVGALLCVVIYYIGKQVHSSWVGYTTALIGTVHPLLIWFTPRLRYEPLLALFVALALLWLLKVRESRSLKDACLMGFFFGYASLVSQVVILLPIVLFVDFLRVKPDKRISSKIFVVALLTMAAVIAPWTVRNYLVAGRVIPVHSGGVMEFVKGNYYAELYNEVPLRLGELDRIATAKVVQLLRLDIDPLEFDRGALGVDQELLPHALSYVRNHPERLLTKIVVQIPRFWYLSESPLKSWFLAAIQCPFLLFALVGVFLALRSKRDVLSLLLTVMYFNLVYAVFHAQARFSTPVIPYIIILAVVGLRSIFDVIRKWQLRQMVNDIRSPVHQKPGEVQR